MITSKGGASEPSDTLLPGRAGGAVAVRRTLASTICRIADPTQEPRPRQLRDASTVMRFRPAHQSMINRRHDDRASCRARHSLKQPLERKPRIHTPATGNAGHGSGENHKRLVPGSMGDSRTLSSRSWFRAGDSLGDRRDNRTASVPDVNGEQERDQRCDEPWPGPHIFVIALAWG